MATTSQDPLDATSGPNPGGSGASLAAAQPPVIFKERWRQKEARIKAQSEVRKGGWMVGGGLGTSPTGWGVVLGVGVGQARWDPIHTQVGRQA